MNDYLYDRRLAFVQRYHAEVTLHKESVAEHQFFVARNAMAICFELKFYGIEQPDIAKAVGMALLHDSIEIVTGDIPGHFKRNYPEVKLAMQDAENDAAYDLYDHLPPYVAGAHRGLIASYSDKTLLESQIVKYADILDIAAFSDWEKRLGNTLLNSPARTAREWLLELDWPWIKQLEKCRSLQK